MFGNEESIGQIMYNFILVYFGLFYLLTEFLLRDRLLSTFFLKLKIVRGYLLKDENKLGEKRRLKMNFSVRSWKCF